MDGGIGYNIKILCFYYFDKIQRNVGVFLSLGYEGFSDIKAENQPVVTPFVPDFTKKMKFFTISALGLCFANCASKIII
ncbi:MAG: hypothetical protein LBG74_02320 [Spirochaetaceae bacterium]|jgi:hypothetical protein|nr:hypothetical protein [Spirochaetaceae bacterium]